jgi:hypothetical protein
MAVTSITIDCEALHTMLGDSICKGRLDHHATEAQCDCGHHRKKTEADPVHTFLAVVGTIVLACRQLDLVKLSA